MDAPTIRRMSQTGFAFRHKFRVANLAATAFYEAEYLLHEDTQTVVWLTGERGKAVSDSDWWALKGTRYASEDEAFQASQYWVGRLERAFAIIGQGADFGIRTLVDRRQMEGAKRASEYLGVPVLDDLHGVMVFPTGQGTVIRGGSGEASWTYAPEILAPLVDSPENVPHHANEAVAFELFSASQFARQTEGSFMLLMMAIEALMKRDRRRQEVRDFVRGLSEALEESTLTPDEKKSLSGGLSRLHVEPPSELGRRLANTLDGNQYKGMSAQEFFAYCYRMRGSLAHPGKGRPTELELMRLLPSLRAFVGDLLGGTALRRVTRQQARHQPGP